MTDSCSETIADHDGLPAAPIPVNPRRVLLVNPTAFLGNLLIAGDLMRRYADVCLARGTELMLVLDSDFRPLMSKAFADVSVLWYPRREIRAAGPWGKLTGYLRVVRAMRRFRADLAFNLEEDSVSTRLVQLSAAGTRLGCSPQRHSVGFDHVLPIEFVRRPPQRRHRWFSYFQVFQALGLREPLPAYLQLDVDSATAAMRNQLRSLAVPEDKVLVTIHPGATKAYKRWPLEHYLELCCLLIDAGFFPVLVGAGAVDTAATRILSQGLDDAGHPQAYVNLCKHLNLRELAALFRLAGAAVGNDSGPFHLASSVGTPGVVIFGPSDSDLWGPLTQHSHVLQQQERCLPGCSRHTCALDYLCLRAIKAEDVFNKLLNIIELKDKSNVN